MKPVKRIRVEPRTEAYGECEFEFRGEPALTPLADALFKAFSPKRDPRQPPADSGLTRYVVSVAEHTFTAENYREAVLQLGRQWPDATPQLCARLKRCRDIRDAVRLLRSAFGIVISDKLAANVSDFFETPYGVLKAMLEEPGGNLVWVGYSLNKKLDAGPASQTDSIDGIAGLQSKHINFEVGTLVTFEIWCELDAALAMQDESGAEAALAEMVSDIFNAIRDERVRVKLATRLLAGLALEDVDGMFCAEPPETLQ